MPSPFPGMDPFLEGAEWEDFHTRFNNAISDALVPRVQPKYVVRLERRVYVETLEGDVQPRKPDVMIAESDADSPAIQSATTAAVVQPVECMLPTTEEIRETYLVIRERTTGDVVTVMETLSPANKRSGSDGRREYLAKRHEVLQSETHLIELDFLRGGLRLPMQDSLPAGDYFAIVSRSDHRPRASVYAWTLRDSLPTIQIPLRQEDDEVPLDLQAVFTTVYDRAAYDLSLPYQEPLAPPLGESDRGWLAECLGDNSQAGK